MGETVEQQKYLYDVFISYADADRAWVEGYLIDALEQAGANYHSEKAFALGVPRLVEFERAIKHSKRTLLILSPAYLAEQFIQFVDLLVQTYGLETATWPTVPLVLRPVELPPRLAMLGRLDATDPKDWDSIIERLCAELERPVPQALPTPSCPYPGMVSFSEADSDRFFGRDREVQELVEWLRLHPLVAVIGPSGSGKSSLVFAGLVPALRKSGLFDTGESMQDGFQWVVRSMRPGESPLDALASALGLESPKLRSLEQAVAQLLSAQPPDALYPPDVLYPHPHARRFLLIVDQFEELFTLSTQDVNAFEQALLALSRLPDCFVALTVRADFYAELMSAALWPEIQQHRFEVLPLNEEGLRQAVMRPAEDVGVYVETALVERLVADAVGEPGILPLIQETLVLLWERLERRFLPLRAYEALVLTRSAYGGDRTGLQIAMARRAEATLGELLPAQQAIARRIFMRLVQFGEGRADTRRQQPVSALLSARDSPQLFTQTLSHLVNSRLLTISGEEGDVNRKVDIAHEALISGWPTLQGWLDERREAEQTRRRLENKGEEWMRLGRGGGGLLDQVELLEAERWLDSPDSADLGYSEVLLALVEASRMAIEQAEREQEAARQRELEQAKALAEEQERRAEEQTTAALRLRRVLIGLAIVFVIAVVAAISALGQRSAAFEAKGTAEAASTKAVEQAQIALSRQLAIQASSLLRERLDLALLLSLEANRVADTLESRGSLLAALQRNPRLITFLYASHTLPVSSVALSPDGQLLAASDGSNVMLWRVDTGQPVHSPLSLADAEPDPETSAGLAFSPDGRTVAAADGNRILLWDVETGRTEELPVVHTGLVTALVFSPDQEGQILASGGDDNTVVLWGLADKQPLGLPLVAHEQGVRSLAFSPDGETLASAAGETICLWRVRDAQLLDKRVEHTGEVTSLAFRSDGETLVSAGRDNRFFQWNVVNARLDLRPIARSDEERPPELPEPGGPWNLVVTPDGKALAVGRFDQIVIWNIDNDVPFLESLSEYHIAASASANGAALSADGEILALGEMDGTVSLWDISTDRSLVGDAFTVQDAVFTPGGEILALSRDGEGSAIWLWNLDAQPPVGEPLIEDLNQVQSMALSHDGQILALSGNGSVVQLWNLDTIQSVGQLSIGQTGGVYDMAFRSDFGVLASVGQDGALQLWDLSSYRPIDDAFDEPVDKPYRVAFGSGAESDVLAVLSEDGTIGLWDMAQSPYERILTIRQPMAQDIALSSDGSILATGGCARPTKPTGCALGQVRVWDVATEQPFGASFTGHSDATSSLAFSPDDSTLISVGADGTILMWDLDFESWKARACRIANRSLTEEEWELYMRDKEYRETCPERSD